MKIFRAIGLGLVIIIISFLMPEVFKAFENTALSFFDLIQTVLSTSEEQIKGGNFLPATVSFP